MFEVDWMGAAELARAGDQLLVTAMADWARAEAAAAAQRLAIIAEYTRRRLASSAACSRWVTDGWDGVAAQVAAATGITAGRASNQMYVATALRNRLPQVAELFAAGHIAADIVATVVWHTTLVQDTDALASIDAALAGGARRYGRLSGAKMVAEIRSVIEKHDPDAVRRTRAHANTRELVVDADDAESGTTKLWGRLYSHDAAALDQRLTALAGTVCDADPRTVAQRRADALGVLATGGDALRCRCARSDCPAAGRTAGPGRAVIYVIAHPDAVATEPDDAQHGPFSNVLEQPPDPGAPLDELARELAEELADELADEHRELEPEPEAELEPAPEPEPEPEPEPGAGSAGSELQGESAGPEPEPEPPEESERPGEPEPPEEPESPGESAGPQPEPPEKPEPPGEQEPPGLPEEAGPAQSPRPAPDPPEPPAPPEPPGPEPPPPPRAAPRGPRPEPPPAPPGTRPAQIIGGPILPDTVLAELIRAGATVKPLPIPGPAPETHYRPSARLAAYIRARDLTCRFPGCEQPAGRCDIDHAIAWAAGGPTHPANLRLLCRKHHLVKTFLNWTDRQHPDGTIDWTGPAGHTHTTRPGSILAFTQLCRPIPGPPPPAERPTDTGADPAGRALKMPRRTRTRAENRADAIAAERRHNHRERARERREHDQQRRAEHDQSQRILKRLQGKHFQPRDYQPEPDPYAYFNMTPQQRAKAREVADKPPF